MELIALQSIFIIVIFLATFGSLMLPLWVFPRDPSLQTGLRSERAMSLCNCLSGGIFLGVCFVGLLPMVRDKFEEIWQLNDVGFRYPVTELGVVLGFFLMLMIEQTVLTYKENQNNQAEMEAMLKHPNEYIMYDSDSVYTEEESDYLEEEVELPNEATMLTSADLKDVEANDSATLPLSTSTSIMSMDTIGQNSGAGDALLPKRQSRSRSRGSRGSRRPRPQSACSGKSMESGMSGHSHAQVFDINQGLLHCLILILALGIHAIFEGLALGLQDNASKLLNLFAAVVIHESLVAVAMGVSMSKRHIPVSTFIKLGLAFCLMIPIGMGIGMAISHTSHTLATDIVSAVIQSLATGTFVYVVFLEILPAEMNVNTDRLLKVLFTFIGFLIIASLRVMVQD